MDNTNPNPPNPNLDALAERLAVMEDLVNQQASTIQDLKEKQLTAGGSVSFVDPKSGVIELPVDPFTVKGKKYKFTKPAFSIPEFGGRKIAAEIMENAELLEYIVKTYPDLFEAA